LDLLPRLGDKAGALGTLVSAMGCAACFPAIASLGAAVGLGFIGQWEVYSSTRYYQCLPG